MAQNEAAALRLADANLNRCLEGLRVMEDTARFLLDDALLSSRLRGLRHSLASQVESSPELYLNLLHARSVEQDVGAAPQDVAEARADPTKLVAANAKRAQESLRVLEEVSKLPTIQGLSPALFQEARFQVYQIEQELVARLARRSRTARVGGLYAIVDPDAPGRRSLLEVAEASVRAGAKVVQLRDKRGDKGIILQDALALKKICIDGDALLIINDHPDIALACDADGVHLGQKDLPISVARNILPIDRIIGISTATLDEAREAAAQGADYVAVGAMFETGSKAETRPAGPATLARVRAALSLPLVAIGGINAENLSEVVAAGADAVAIISALSLAENVEAMARQILEEFYKAYEHSDR